jgi:anti-sigma regulatory factor (Ser/Thr protein kinase)
VARANAAAKASHRPYTAEYRLLRAQPAADGRDTWLWVLDTGVPRYDPDGRFLGYVGTCVDISERRAQEREKAAFLRDVLASVTEGRLRLCEQPSDLPAPLPALPGASGDSLTLTEETLYLLRRRIRETGAALGFPPERTADLMSAAHEAAMNAVQHGGGAASARLHAAPDGSRMQVWVQDRGAGIRVADLPKATLLRGHSGRGGFGHGYVLILSYADAVHLLTGPGGTTVVLEQACCESPRGEW